MLLAKSQRPERSRSRGCGWGFERSRSEREGMCAFTSGRGAAAGRRDTFGFKEDRFRWDRKSGLEEAAPALQRLAVVVLSEKSPSLKFWDAESGRS